MTVPLNLSRSTRRLPTRKTNTLTFCMIFLLGIIVGHFMNASSLSETALSSSPSLQAISKTNDEGWNSIDVFYGSNSNFESTLPQDLDWYSQAGQDEIVLSLLKNKTGGYFVDLAANNATKFSNTFIMERNYNWNGLCIEPNAEYFDSLVHRKCKIVAAVVGHDRMEEVRFRFDAGDHGGIAGRGFDNGARFKSQSQVRYTVTLREILERYMAPSHIDYLSLDVEGAEEFIMKGFPFDKYHISIMTTERPSNPLREIIDKNGFKNVARLTRWGEVMWAHESVWDSLDMSILDRLDEIKTIYRKRYENES